MNCTIESDYWPDMPIKFTILLTVITELKETQPIIALKTKQSNRMKKCKLCHINQSESMVSLKWVPSPASICLPTFGTLPALYKVRQVFRFASQTGIAGSAGYLYEMKIITSWRCEP
jgi:hypothetical protein